MNIYDYADALNLQLELTRYANQEGRWTAKFEHCNTMDEPDAAVMAGTYGSGKTPQQAIENYAKQLAGKILVVDAPGFEREKRREYRVPTLTTEAP